MSIHVTKTWIEDGELITETVPQESIYKREWQGLTNEEIFEIHKQVDSMQYLKFGKAIESKLKEKNT